MESFGRNEKAYDLAWFKERAHSAIRKVNEGVWDYSDSLLLYLPSADHMYEAVQEMDTPYNRLVTVPERKFLKDISSDIVAVLPNRFEYIDLGPGTEHKEQFIFDAAKGQQKQFIYRPVDISARYLALAGDYAEAQGLETNPLQSSFEELSIKLGNKAESRFVSLGLTYGNYNSHEILNLLKEISGDGGSAFINAQLRERTDIAAIRNIYADVIADMVSPKISLLGINPDKDISEIEVTDDVRVWCNIKHVSPELEIKGVRAGDRILLFQSIRPTLENFEKDVSSIFPDYKLFDTGESFVAAVLK